uniref:Conserved domain protein n=1 Tax=Caenorhabditis tropicalis TaxID=1561998 RepID=A0A1I7TWT4_9PELO
MNEIKNNVFDDIEAGSVKKTSGNNSAGWGMMLLNSLDCSRKIDSRNKKHFVLKMGKSDYCISYSDGR